MPYTIRKRKCKNSKGKSGNYTLSYTDKKGKKHSACHGSRKGAQGQIAAIEAEGVMEKVLHRLLLESGSALISLVKQRGYAAHVFDGGKSRQAIIYLPSRVEVGLKEGRSLEDAAFDSIVGSIRIVRPVLPCNDAWEVGHSAMPKQGDLLYAIAFGLSPTGRLMPDRSGPSKGALSRWRKIANERPEVAKEKDQIESGEEFKKYDHHLDDSLSMKTQEKGDDCSFDEWGFQGAGAVYDAKGWEKDILNELTYAHEEAANRLDESRMINSIATFEAVLVRVGDKFFQETFSSNY